ncbi:MAG: glucose-1-phosphate cytidylyltransferase [Oligoflexales bacterium]|nr:glucose-1-phosphate cytidylyltransferase [Oligoflexales bacterium]
MSRKLLDRNTLSQIAEETPVILLAGGLGTRLSEETANIPKPMVKLGNLPIIVHIMDYYASFGFKHFIICGGYRIDVLKDFFITLPYAGKDIEISFSKDLNHVKVNPSEYVSSNRTNWQVTVLETGLHSMTGYRVAKAVNTLNKKGFKRYCLTYGDGLTNVDLHQELTFHLEHKKIGTVLGVHQPTRFGIFKLDKNDKVTEFAEKPQFSNEFINGGYFIFEKGFEKFIDGDNPDCIFEQNPLVKMSNAGELFVFRHEGFWQCMDTMREKLMLEKMLNDGKAPWLRNL